MSNTELTKKRLIENARYANLADEKTTYLISSYLLNDVVSLVEKLEGKIKDLEVDNDNYHKDLIDCMKQRNEYKESLAMSVGESLEARSQWISVADRLPEGNCLVYLAEESLGRKIHSANYGSKVVTVGHYFEWDAPEVTHWMELPSIPTEE